MIGAGLSPLGRMLLDFDRRGIAVHAIWTTTKHDVVVRTDTQKITVTRSGRVVVQELEGPNGQAGNLYLVRCFACDPDRGRENYLFAVASGQCAWCGWPEPKIEGTDGQATGAGRADAQTPIVSPQSATLDTRGQDAGPPPAPARGHVSHTDPGDGYSSAIQHYADFERGTL